jgi:hypothetical protein
VTQEKTLRRRILLAINQTLECHAVAIENKLETGTPDVNYCVYGAEGWLELKSIPSFPKHSNTVVRIEHFTLDQRRWIKHRQNVGGRAGVVLQVGDEVFLFMDITAVVIGTLTEDQIRKRCTASWKRSIVWPEFIERIGHVSRTEQSATNGRPTPRA